MGLRRNTYRAGSIYRRHILLFTQRVCRTKYSGYFVSNLKICCNFGVWMFELVLLSCLSKIIATMDVLVFLVPISFGRNTCLWVWRICYLLVYFWHFYLLSTITATFLIALADSFHEVLKFRGWVVLSCGVKFWPHITDAGSLCTQRVPHQPGMGILPLIYSCDVYEVLIHGPTSSYMASC